MKQTTYSQIWKLMDTLRSQLSFQDSIDLLSTLIAAKLISNNNKILSIDEANSIIAKKYDVLVNYEIQDKIRDQKLMVHFLNEINTINFDNTIVEWLLEKSTQSKFGMIYDFKPGSVKDLAKIVQISSEGVIADINANLSSFIKEVIKNNKFTGKVILYGKTITQLRLSFINIFPVNRNIELRLVGNTVPVEVNQKFDFVFAMPPFGLRYAEDPIPKIIKSSKQFLKQKGSMILVTPSGFLFNSKYKQERNILLNHFNIDSIIHLTNAFKPYTAIETALFHIINEKSTHKKIFVAELNFLDDSFDDIKTIINAYKAHLNNKTIKNVSPLTNRVTKEDLKDDFIIRRFDPKTLILEEKISKKYKIENLGYLCDIKRSNSRYSSKDYVQSKNNTLPYIRIQDIKEGSINIEKSQRVIRKNPKELTLKENDVLLSVSGIIGKIGLVDKKSKGSLISHGLVVLRIKNNSVDPVYLYHIFQSEYVLNQLNNMSQGGIIPHISIKQLEELKIPIIPLTKQRAVISKIKKISKQLEDIKKKKDRLEKELQKQLKEVFL